MAVKVEVGSLTSIYTGTEQQVKVVLLFLRIMFTEKRIEIKKPSYKKELQKEKKTNYDQSSDRFDDQSPVALVFLDRFLMVYKPVNARGACSLNIFPGVGINFLEMKPET